MGKRIDDGHPRYFKECNYRNSWQGYVTIWRFNAIGEFGIITGPKNAESLGIVCGMSELPNTEDAGTRLARKGNSNGNNNGDDDDDDDDGLED
ncbi:uncharacterized protein BP5553_05179 [Venustampulla echinocandica]|uniref:Uncharacterized protein n=1 Tax=Venustampulla echinocandica TaxID=2656787 RepID=A0A370TQE1_9HELO|nr:uncharacterized protein BP5553_05179 [Venustampulla echinocandica]RDL37746.1 hypothetical protein BP5553_05179 [Venustampulla echinocandica]